MENRNKRYQTPKGQLKFSYSKKMGDFIEPGTHPSTNIKVKIETLWKKSEMYFS